uniref:type IV secretion system protein n=1 Tax=Snodgrassella sp. CFCC 13594 TaxID=1775559 RepID=UPI0026F46C88
MEKLVRQCHSNELQRLLKGKSYTPEQAAKSLFANYDSTMKSFQDTKKRLSNIQQLMAKINTTQDVKAAADLQSRISAEQAIIQNNQTKLDMMSKMF